MTDEEKSKAMRYARVIAQEIALYNEQKIVQGIEQDNLFDAIKDQLEEGREAGVAWDLVGEDRKEDEEDECGYYRECEDDALV